MTQIYQIRVRGHLSGAWSEWFDGLAIENLPNGEALLRGPVADKAALYGLLIKVRDLNLTLLAVTLIEPEQGLQEGF
ncbi:MAG: hypothetical protein ACK2UA_10340 [Anaerolineae bacterium]|jgi:hypothetical protein